MAGPDGNEMALNFDFKVDGEKLSGSVETPNGPMDFTDGKIKGDEFSFKVEFDGNSIDHQCKITGDTISMKVMFGPEGGADVTLTRVASTPAAVAPVAPAAPASVAAPAPKAALAAAANPTGNWEWAFTPPNSDQSFQSLLKLEWKDGKLTGILTGRMGETPITAATFGPDGAIAFAVERERDGNKFVVKYSGKLAGDTIKGTMELPGWNGGEPRMVDWNATRGK